jgi:hypothetical protein
MIVKIDEHRNDELSADHHKFVKFLKENTHGGKVDPFVELFSTVKMQAKAGQETEVYPWVMSTFDLDRDNERIDVKGWNLREYCDNPVVLWSHDHMIPAIGCAQNVKAEDILSGDILFNPKDADEFGWGIGQRVKFGSIRSGSVSFCIDEVEFVDHRASPDAKEDLIYRKQQLLEFSICNIPANPFALCADGGKTADEEPATPDTYNIRQYFNRRYAV